VPDWSADPIDEAEAKKWPLRLLTAPGYFQAHTAYSGVGFLREREGKPFCVLHPADAAKRNLADGADVRLFNGRGEIGLKLKVSDEVQPGVVLVPGQRPTARPCRARSTCSAPTATRHGRRARRTRAPGSMSGRGRRD
jgi:anaerobic selenocysteine-containing dehydrogenase